MKAIRLTFLLIFACTILRAQNTNFITNGIIEYEKSVNMYAIMQKTIHGDNSLNQQVVDQYKSAHPQFLVMKSSLSFTNGKTLFEPIQSPTFPGYDPAAPFVQPNNIYTDLLAGSITVQKNVLGEPFLLKDSSRNITWKITDETREIAGFLCRRANAVIMDSIYVVAFYTDNIPISGGPESFAGLPGMILQIALPHENIKWVATSVTDKSIPSLRPPAKGKPVTDQQLHTILNDALKNRGAAQIQSFLKGLLL